MNRGTPEYIEHCQRVKVGWFTESDLKMDIHGIVHVGCGDGYEMHHYKLMGITNLVGVDPLPLACQKFRQLLPEIPLYECALSDVPGKAMLTVVTPGDGQGSSLLVECRPNPDYNYDTRIEVEVRRGDELPLVWELYDCLVMDVQGNEGKALQGFGTKLDWFRMINVECSAVPIYEGGASANEVELFLNWRGFVRMTEIPEHDDVLYVRKDCL